MKICFFIFLLLPGTLVSAPECLYDYTQDFSHNCKREEPLSSFTFYQEPKSVRNLLGYPLYDPIGISACAIMTSNGIKWASQAGYNVLTYKTVRSAEFDGHPLPNLMIIETDGIATLPSESEFTANEVSMANSMGIPSLSLDWVLNDIAKSRSYIHEGQVLIVSILGNELKERSLSEDFAYLAKSVVKAGAQVVEVNLSCPNLHSPLETYKDPTAVYTITKAVCDVIPDTPVIIKVGIFDSLQQMRNVFFAASQAKIRGICGINAIPTKIFNKEGKPAFGSGREVAGLSGNCIRSHALNFIKDARKIIIEEKLDFILFATGGVTKGEHFIDFLDAGADIVLSATGAMWNPALAAECIECMDSHF